MIKRAVFIFPIILNFFHFSASAQQKKIDSLRSVLALTKNDTLQLNILNKIAKLFDKDHMSDSAFVYVNKVVLLADKYLQTSIKTDVGRTAEKKNILINKAVAVSRKAYMNADVGNYPQAMEGFTTAKNTYEELSDKASVSRMYNNIAMIHRMQGDYPKALNDNLESLKIKEQLNDEYGIAISYSNIGIIYGLMEKNKEALENFQKAKKIYEKVKDQEGIAESLIEIGNVQLSYFDTSSAFNNYMEALSIFKTISSTRNVGLTNSQLGSIYMGQRNFSLAMKYEMEALKIFEAIGDIENLSMCNNNIGEILGKQGKYSDALTYFTKALAIGKEIGSKEDMKSAYHGLSESYFSTGDYKRSLENFKLFSAIKDSLLNEDKTREIGRLEAKGEFDKQQAIGDAIHKNEIEKKDAIAAADNKRKNTIIFSVAAGLLLVIVFAFFIFNRFKVTQKQKQIIEIKNKETEEQKSIIEEKQKEIIDSINYAKRIQFTLLAHQELLKENLKDHFVLFMPKDIVSGDFYWATKKEDRFYLAVCDSTGHGVPGAFMSLLNITFLNEAVIEKNIKEPNLVLDHVRKRLIENMEGGQDGMDAILICLDSKNNACTFSAANNSPLIIKNGIPLSLDADKMPVGKGISSEPFTLFTMDLKKDDLVYLYTDGYADQFGGPKGKKFKYKQLEEKLSLVCEMPFEEQRKIMQRTILDWKGEFEQVDDICLIGLKV